MKTQQDSAPKRRKKKQKRYHLKKDDPNYLRPDCKLTDEIEADICKLIKSQMSLTDACEWVGLDRNTVWQWRARGQAQPHTRFGRFDRAVKKALLIAKAYLIQSVAQHPDLKGKLFILKNRYPDEFRDRIIQEMSGLDGAPIAVAANPFAVTITLATEPEAKPTEWKIRNHANGAESSRAP